MRPYERYIEFLNLLRMVESLVDIYKERMKRKDVSKMKKGSLKILRDELLFDLEE